MTLNQSPDQTYQWPNHSSAAVSLTFDVDAESALLGLGLDTTSYSAFSERRFGIARGLSRILRLLADHQVKGTFYVPGYTAESYPDAIASISEAGHEIAHHGYLHKPPNSVSPSEQRGEMERGCEALKKLTGAAPIGYRSPSWEVTEYTFQLLKEMGFKYDSSCMGDDWPYIETAGGVSMLELPVHWSLDDWAYYSWFEGKGLLSDPEAVARIWISEFEEALTEGGHVTYTFHPEVSGRRSRFAALKTLVEHIAESGKACFATHGEIAELALRDSSDDK